jgi:hypothetical protein
VHTETAGLRGRSSLPKKKPYLAAAVIPVLSSQRLKPGDRTADIFDPSTMAQSAVQVEVIGREDIQVMGQPLAATHQREPEE